MNRELILNINSYSGKVSFINIKGTLKIAIKKTFKNILLLNKWKKAFIFLLNVYLSENTTFATNFLKFSAPPLFHLNC